MRELLSSSIFRLQAAISCIVAEMPKIHASTSSVSCKTCPWQGLPVHLGTSVEVTLKVPETGILMGRNLICIFLRDERTWESHLAPSVSRGSFRIPSFCKIEAISLCNCDEHIHAVGTGHFKDASSRCDGGSTIRPNRYEYSCRLYSATDHYRVSIFMVTPY